MKKWILIIIAVLFIGFIAFRAVSNYQKRIADQRHPVGEKIIPIVLTQPRKQETAEVIRAAGNILANAEVTLYSKVPGKIRDNLVHMGSAVKPGTMVSLVIRDEIGYEFQPYEVTSNVKGVISKVLQNPGAVVTPNTPLMTLVDIDTVKAVAAVDELKIRFIRIGQTAEVSVQAYPGEMFMGKVSSISPVCNQTNRTVEVEIRIPNLSHHLKPGMYAEAEFKQNRRTVLTLPVIAVIEKAGRKVVFVPQNGKALPVTVVTGSVLEDAVEIVSGLNGDEFVAASGASLLEDGSRITVVESAH
jgi:membrane fusion protein (multidrug efflux system)